jgi:hypothetical protein
MLSFIAGGSDTGHCEPGALHGYMRIRSSFGVVAAHVTRAEHLSNMRTSNKAKIPSVCKSLNFIHIGRDHHLHDAVSQPGSCPKELLCACIHPAMSSYLASHVWPSSRF